MDVTHHQRSAHVHLWFELIRPTAEIAMFLFILFNSFNSMALQSFLTYSMCLERFAHHFSNQSAVNVGNSATAAILHEFCLTNISADATYEADVSELSALTSDWVFYTNLCMYLPGLFSAALLGAWGDLHSRKLAVLVPVGGISLGVILCWILANYFTERFLAT